VDRLSGVSPTRIKEKKMNRTRALAIVMAAGCLAATSVFAAPDPKITGKYKKPGRHLIGPIADLPFTDNFDSYQNGAPISTCGTWKKWAPNSVDGVVSNAQSSSAPHSLKLEVSSDNVQTGSITSGKTTLKMMTYFDSNGLGAGGAWIIGLNTFGLVNNWSMQIVWDNTLFNPPFPGQMGSIDGIGDGSESPVDIIADKWVELRVEIDLDADKYDAFYNNTQIVHGRSWTEGASGGGAKEIQCFDFYSSGNSAFYYDDVSVSTGSACYPDCDGSGELDIDDFICYQTAFGFGDDYADCDGSGELDIDDFICFQTLFGFNDPGADCDGSGELDIDDFICYQTAYGIGCG
jgi:hypothetical protein